VPILREICVLASGVHSLPALQTIDRRSSDLHPRGEQVLRAILQAGNLICPF
jgi:hypothetical protein